MTSPTAGPIHPTIECKHCKTKVMLSVYVWSDVRNILSNMGWVREYQGWECPDCIEDFEALKKKEAEQIARANGRMKEGKE